jgi:signal transduction histidine kinase
MIMQKVFFFILLFLPLSIIGQEPVDLLEQQMNEVQGEEQLRLIITLGNIYAKTDPDRGLELGLKAAFLSKRIGNIKYEGQALLLMGLSSLNAEQSENALRYYNRALSHFEKHNELLEQAIALEGIAEVYNLARNFDLAISHLNRALAIANSMNNVDLMIDIHQRIGSIALNQNNFSLAHREFSHVLDLFRGRVNLTDIELEQKANSYRKIGLTYRNLGQLNEGLSSFRRALQLSRNLQESTMEIEDLYEIATSFYLLQELDSALMYFNQVLAYHQLQNDSISMVEVLLSIGDVFFEKMQYRQAVASYNRSLELAIYVGNVQGQVSALVNISRCFNAFGDYPSSKEYLNKALLIATRENLTNSAADVYKYLSQVHEEEGRFMQALEHYKLWAELRDSIYSEESGQKMARMQILYDITQKEKENEILRQNSEIQKLQLTKTQYQRVVFIVLALFLFALLVLLGFFYSIKQRELLKQKETEQRIVEMNKNLEKRMIEEIKKQEKQQLLLAQKSKLESLGTLAAGIAHEINQPLGGISMGLDNILFKLSENNYTEEYLKEKLNLLFENVDRIKKIIDHTRTFSRTQKQVSFERVDLNGIVRSALAMVQSQYQKNGVKFILDLSEGIEPIIADKYKLEQVVLNFLSNAKHAIDQKEILMIEKSVEYIKTIEISSHHDSDYVYLTVSDNGIGIKQRDIEKIFDPFFTTKKEDSGTGLGLSISYGFIKDILGEIRVDSQEGEYTYFEVLIPKS